MTNRVAHARSVRSIPRATSLLCAAFAAILAGCADDRFESVAPLERRVLFVGVEGLDFDALEPLFKDGQLKHLAALRRRGITIPIFGERASRDPDSWGLDPAESWTTVATGFSPSRAASDGASHGIRDLTVRVDGRYEPLPVTTAHRQVPAFWHVLSAAGVKCAISGWWCTWPAEPVNGYLVSDRFFLEKFGLGAFGEAGRVDLPRMPADYRSGARYLAWPDDLADSLAAEIQPRVERPQAQIAGALLQLKSKAGDAATMSALRQVEQAVRTDLAVKESLLALLRRDPSIRFAGCHLDALDVATHLFWMHIDPSRWLQNRDTGVRGKVTKDHASFANVIPMAAITVDAIVRDLCAAMGPDTTVILTTDHTLQADADLGNRDFGLNRLLEYLGLLVRAPDGSIDWSRTKCFDRTDWPTSFIRHVSVNFAGEWPQGFVPCGSPQERAAVWREVQNALFSVTIDGWQYRKPDGSVVSNLLWDCWQGEVDSHFVAFQALPSGLMAKVPLPGGEIATIAVDVIFPHRPTFARHDAPGMLLLSYPGETGDRHGERGIPMGKGGGQSRQIAPLVLGLFGIPGSQRPDETAPNADFLYWMLDVPEAQRLVLAPRVESYDARVRFTDPSSVLGARRAEQRAYIEGLGYSFEGPASLAVTGDPDEEDGTSRPDFDRDVDGDALERKTPPR